MHAEAKRRPAPAWLRMTRIAVLTALGIVVVFGYQLARLYTDWVWFREVGRPTVYTTILGARLTLFFGFGLLFFAFFYFNVWLAGRLNARKARPQYMDPEREIYAQIARAATRWLGVGGAVFFAFLVGGNASTHWSEYMQFTRAENFGVTDPVFGHDVGFYTFRLPFLGFLQGWMLFTLGAAAIGAAIIHYGERAADFVGGSLAAIAPAVRKHLLTLAALFAFVFAWGHWLARYDVLWSNNGAFVGAGYTDIHARVPAQIVQAFLMILVGVLCMVNASKGRAFFLPAIGIGAWFVGSLLMVSVWPSFVQRFRVVPNQFTAEKAYIERDLKFTRQAYGLDKVTEQSVSSVANLRATDLASNQETIDNIRLWDWPQLGAVYEAKQALRQYYRFRLPEFASFTTGDFNIDVDRYQLGKEYRQVMVSPRELYPEGLPTQARTWINLRLQYTHGYGIVMSPVNRVDDEGLPEYFMGQIPVESRRPELALERPQIYYGELAQDYVFINSKQDELDYPGPEGNVTTRYVGKGGAKLGGYLNRLMWATRLGDANVLLSNDLTAQSRIMFRRNIRERVQTLAPWLNWDNDPYIVLHNGRLVWILDGYTVSDRYPYSRQSEVGTGSTLVTQSFNYIRNSVKAVVDAYDGTVTFYSVDDADPVLRLWRKAFPNLVAPLSAMPSDLRAHLRYPEDMFRIQRDIYTVYHMTDARMYYGKEDQWEVPPDPGATQEDGVGSVGRMTPYYVNMRLPGAPRTEFLLMTPFTPTRTQNMSGWMCAKCDPDDYGQLFVYRFPKGVNVNGPQQIMAQINSQEDISRTITLLGQRGSRVIWGNLLAIPIGRSLLYALPLYIQAAGPGAASIPEINQVVLATGDRIVMRPTLEEAVAALGSGAGKGRSGAIGQASRPDDVTTRASVAPSGPATRGDLIQRASEAYQRARAQQKEYDAALEDLGRALKALESGSSGP
ncbi:MAG: UPF0182 family protein [Armatimonadetes bacterium]|nr:UPF0182 family protein [Armatimonadota bacterium]